MLLASTVHNILLQSFLALQVIPRKAYCKVFSFVYEVRSRDYRTEKARILINCSFEVGLFVVNVENLKSINNISDFVYLLLPFFMTNKTRLRGLFTLQK